MTDAEWQTRTEHRLAADLRLPNTTCPDHAQ